MIPSFTLQSNGLTQLSDRLSFVNEVLQDISTVTSKFISGVLLALLILSTVHCQVQVVLHITPNVNYDFYIALGLAILKLLSIDTGWFRNVVCHTEWLSATVYLSARLLADVLCKMLSKSHQSPPYRHKF